MQSCKHYNSISCSKTVPPPSPPPPSFLPRASFRLVIAADLYRQPGSRKRLISLQSTVTCSLFLAEQPIYFRCSNERKDPREISQQSPWSLHFQTFASPESLSFEFQTKTVIRIFKAKGRKVYIGLPSCHRLSELLAVAASVWNSLPCGISHVYFNQPNK